MSPTACPSSFHRQSFRHPEKHLPLAADSRYEVRLATNAKEVRSALRLRYEVFKVELKGKTATNNMAELEFDSFDMSASHLIVVERDSGQTVGTYRLIHYHPGRGARSFYSYGEFTIEDLPAKAIERGIEIGRACVAPAHRNTKVLFLLWSALATYLVRSGRRYFFGCCSIFTCEEKIGRMAYRQLKADGSLDDHLWVNPRTKDGSFYRPAILIDDGPVKLPDLFKMYLRIGAKVCSPPVIDKEFGTIDFFVVFDVQRMSEKYRRMFIRAF